MDPAGGVPAPPTVTVETLEQAEYMVDFVAGLLRVPITGCGRPTPTAALFLPRPHTLVVSGVDPLRDARAILQRVEFARHELAWRVVRRKLLLQVARIDACLEEIESRLLPPVVEDIHNRAALLLLLQQGERILTLGTGFSLMDGHDPHLRTLAVEVYGMIYQVDQFRGSLGPILVGALLYQIGSTIRNAREHYQIRFYH